MNILQGDDTFPSSAIKFQNCITMIITFGDLLWWILLLREATSTWNLGYRRGSAELCSWVEPCLLLFLLGWGKKIILLHPGQKNRQSSSTQVATLVLKLLCKALPKFSLTHAVLGHTYLLSWGLLFVYKDRGLEAVNTLMVPFDEKSWKR